ncbi:chemotaxis protein CheA [Curvivirga sp.]|uniref:chemotaxis protein CheA n=1 Tax=Curvivirga sp. TaxID=2856848 RepID=UPI003B59949F
MSDLGDFNLDQFKATYFEECNELLADAETRLMSLQQNPDSAEPEDLHAIFRAVHSVKGGGGAFNFDQLVHFAHIYEALLDSMREGKVAVTEEVVDLLLSANDVLNNLIQAAQDGEELPEEAWADVAVELEALQSGASVEDDEDGDDDEEEIVDLTGDDPSDAIESEDDAEGSDTKSGKIWKIEFTPEPHLLQYANEPLLLIRELKTLGTLNTFVFTDKLPMFGDLKHDDIYFSWIFFLRTDKDRDAIEEVFEFVEFDCTLTVTEAQEGDFERLVEALGGTASNAGSIEAEEGVSWGLFIDEKSKDEIESDQGWGLFDEEDSSDVAEKSKDEIESEQGWGLFDDEVEEEASKSPSSKKEDKNTKEAKSSVPAKAKSTAPTAAKKAPGAKPAAGGGAAKISSIRVDLDRVDRLVNMVGELVITQAMLQQQSSGMPIEYAQMMKQGFDDLAMHTRELQDSVMAIRMQPVKSVFARMPRLVRELSGKLGKKVDLVTSGENTEVDKTVVELLADPLTHMIRNSLDHGIETEDERLDVGKTPRATVHLSAEHRGGRIQIDIADDGRGINRERVLGKAIEKGLVPENHQLSPEEVDELIFMPGFSTAEEVTDVSGRGVGMDVVRRNISNLGGRISVSSVPGKGTKFNMSLPLTLAVLDGMVTAVADEKYVIPLTAIVESIRPEKEDIHRLATGGEVVFVRGEYIRLIYLHDVFGIKGAITDPSEALVVLVELDGGGHAGIVVDDLLGQQQVVIKSLEDNYDPVPGVSAATILGNGLVALILDVDGLTEMTHGRGASRRNVQSEKDLLVQSEQKYG